jgi:hypothetical protein
MLLPLPPPLLLLPLQLLLLRVCKPQCHLLDLPILEPLAICCMYLPL